MKSQLFLLTIDLIFNYQDLVGIAYEFWLNEYQGNSGKELGNYFTELRNNTSDKQLFDLIYWTTCRVFFYLIVPVLAIKIFMKKRISDFGWNLSDNLNRDLKIFTVFFFFMFPLVFWVSTQDSFLLKYPFYHIQNL